MPEQTTTLLSLAAVAGREFHLRMLEVTADLDSERLLELVEAALVTGVVVEDRVERLSRSAGPVRHSVSVLALQARSSLNVGTQA